MERMVENIAIVSLVREQAYEVGKLLATELEMHFVDCIELFEFDNIPRDLTAMLKEYGARYYRKKEKGALSYVSGFSDAVICLEGGMAKAENFKTVKERCLLIYLHSPLSTVKKKLAATKFKSPEQKRFFFPAEKTLLRRQAAYKKNADIVINAAGCSDLKLSSMVLRKIKEFYQ